MTIALVERPAPNPMSEQDDHKTNSAVKMVSRGATADDKSRLFVWAERWLRPAGQLDYMIRRWMIPVPFEANRLIAIGPFFRWSHEYSRQASRSTPHAAPSRRGNELLSEFRVVIGQSGSLRSLSQPGALSDNLSDETGIPNGDYIMRIVVRPKKERAIRAS